MARRSHVLLEYRCLWIYSVRTALRTSLLHSLRCLLDILVMTAMEMVEMVEMVMVVVVVVEHQMLQERLLELC